MILADLLPAAGPGRLARLAERGAIHGQDIDAGRALLLFAADRDLLADKRCEQVGISKNQAGPASRSSTVSPDVSVYSVDPSAAMRVPRVPVTVTSTFLALSALSAFLAFSGLFAVSPESDAVAAPVSRSTRSRPTRAPRSRLSR